MIGPAAFVSRFLEISAKREKKEGPLITNNDLYATTYLSPVPTVSNSSFSTVLAARHDKTTHKCSAMPVLRTSWASLKLARAVDWLCPAQYYEF